MDMNPASSSFSLKKTGSGILEGSPLEDFLLGPDFDLKEGFIIHMITAMAGDGSQSCCCCQRHD